MGVKDFLARKMLERQMKDLPPEQKEVMIKAITENPEFFETIAKEIKAKTKEGKSEMTATMEVMRKHQGELQKIMGGGQQQRPRMK